MSSYGQTLLGDYLRVLLKPKYQFREDYRPSWLNGMEIDFYYEDEELKLGIEFQGDQHFSMTKYGDYHAQAYRDRLKKRICKERGVILLALDASDLICHKIRWWFHSKKLRRVLARGIPLSITAPMDHKCTAYRKLLREKYNSPTVHKRGKHTRYNAIRAAEGKPPLPPLVSIQ